MVMTVILLKAKKLAKAQRHLDLRNHILKVIHQQTRHKVSKKHSIYYYVQEDLMLIEKYCVVNVYANKITQNLVFVLGTVYEFKIFFKQKKPSKMKTNAYQNTS